MFGFCSLFFIPDPACMIPRFSGARTKRYGRGQRHSPAAGQWLRARSARVYAARTRPRNPGGKFHQKLSGGKVLT